MKNEKSEYFFKSSDGVYCKKQRHQGSEIFLRRLNLVELLEANHRCDFSECSSRDVGAVLSDETRSAASDSALSETSAFGVFALVREPDVFVSHVGKVC